MTAPFNYAAKNEDGSSKYATYISTKNDHKSSHASSYDPSIASTSYDSRMPYIPLEEARKKEQAIENAKKENATKQSTFVSVNVPNVESKEETQFVNKLKGLELIVENQKTSQNEATNIIKDLRRKLEEDRKKEQAPVNIQTQASTPASSIKTEPVLDFTKQHDLILQSLSRMVNDPSLQVEKPEVVYHDIIQNTYVPELEESIKSFDLKTHNMIIESLSTTPSHRDKKNPENDVLVPVKVRNDLIHVTEGMHDLLGNALLLVDDSILDLIGEDLPQAVARLDKVHEIIQHRLSILVEMSDKDEKTLLAMFNNEEIFSKDDRAMAALFYLERMSDKNQLLDKDTYNLMTAFINENSQETKENIKRADSSEFSQCPPDQLLQDTRDKFKDMITNIQRIQDAQAKYPTGIAENVKKLDSSLENVADALQKKADSTNDPEIKKLCLNQKDKVCEDREKLRSTGINLKEKQGK